MTDGELIARVGEGDAGAFDSSTGATRDRCSRSRSAAWATVGGPRTPSRRRSPRSGARRGATGTSGPGRALALRRRAERDRRPAARARRAPRGAGRRSLEEAGAAERAEASWTAWRIHRALAELPDNERAADRARLLGRAVAERDRRVPQHPPRHGQDTNAKRARPAWPSTRRGALMSRHPDFRELVGNDLEPRSANGSSGCTTCWSQAGPPPELRRCSPILPRPRGAGRAGAPPAPHGSRRSRPRS